MSKSKAALVEKIDASRTRYYYRDLADAEELRQFTDRFWVVVKQEPGFYVIDLCKPPIIWWNP
jgi:hypothetical protein